MGLLDRRKDVVPHGRDAALLDSERLGVAQVRGECGHACRRQRERQTTSEQMSQADPVRGLAEAIPVLRHEPPHVVALD